MRIQLSDHFNFGKLMRFVLPSIVMMVFTSIYGVVDGLFVSNFAGKTAFAAINLIMPFPMGLASIGFMIGTGGSALVSKTMGEGNKEKANSYFTMLVVFSVILGVIVALIGEIILEPVAKAMGADSTMMNDCLTYGRIFIAAMPSYFLQNVFQSFFVTAEKPKLGLLATVGAGVANMVGDALLVGVFNFGVAGAAVATLLSTLVGGVLPLFYFAKDNDSRLRFASFKFELKALVKVCTNGSSELMSNLSASIVSVAYNVQLMAISGENGVAAYGTLMYVNFIFAAVFIGYSIGVAPIISYNYGTGDNNELKNLLKKSMIIMAVGGVLLSVAAFLLSTPFSKLYVGYDAELFEMTVHAFKMYALAFLLCGFNIFASAFFTALNNGLISAVISFVRTLVFQLACVFILPVFFDIDGVWLAISVAELLALIMSIIFIIANRKKYGY